MATAVLGSRVRKGSARPFNRRGRGGGRAEEGAAGAGREARGGRGLSAWRGGHPRGARRRGKGAWRAQGRQRRWFGAIPGARERFGARARCVGGQVASAPAYGAAVGVVQGGER